MRGEPEIANWRGRGVIEIRSHSKPDTRMNWRRFYPDNSFWSGRYINRGATGTQFSSSEDSPKGAIAHIRPIWGGRVFQLVTGAASTCASDTQCTDPALPACVVSHGVCTVSAGRFIASPPAQERVAGDVSATEIASATGCRSGRLLRAHSRSSSPATRALPYR